MRILFFIVDPVQPRNKKRDITCLALRNSPWIFKSTSLHGPVSFVSVQLFPNDQSKSSLELCFRHQSVMRQATVKQVTYAIKVNTHWRWDTLRRHNIPRGTCRVFFAKIVVPPECRIKCSWFEFNDLNFQCRILRTALAKSLRYNLFQCTSLRAPPCSMRPMCLHEGACNPLTSTTTCPPIRSDH